MHLSPSDPVYEERVRGVYAYGGTQNAADRGCLSNWASALCGRQPPSKLPADFSRLVSCSECIDEKTWDVNSSSIGQLSPERISSAANVAAQLNGEKALGRNNSTAAEEGKAEGRE
jgi:hypothetical protein